MAWLLSLLLLLLLLLLLFVFILVVVCFLFVIIYYVYYYIMYLLLLIIFSMWDGVRTKDRFFQKGWRMGVEALIRKNTVFFGGEGLRII